MFAHGCRCLKTTVQPPATEGQETDMHLPANPTRRRAEEAFLIQARLRNLDEKLNRLVVEVGASPPLPLTFDDYDVQFLAESLADDRSWLPHGSHVETTCVDTSPPLSRPYGATYTDTATSVSIPILGTFTPRQLLEQGLVTKGGRWNHVAYEAALKATPGVVSGRLMGPREAMLDRQEAGRAKYPRLWTNG
jgi:hypothetical protein